VNENIYTKAIELVNIDNGFPWFPLLQIYRWFDIYFVDETEFTAIQFFFVINLMMLFA
jgi:hypothetical protein